MGSFFKGFAYAARGIYRAVLEERNLRFHLCAALYVYAFSSFYSFTTLQYALLTVVVAGVIALELVNSALERVMDGLSPHPNRMAKQVKDMGAGAVLVFSIGAAVCGFLLFWDIEVFKAIGAFFWKRPVALAALALSVVASAGFVFLLPGGNVDE